MNQKLIMNKLKKKRDPLTCQPLKSFDEINEFIENPPPWRTLCKEIVPHSNYVIRNMDNVRDSLCLPNLNEATLQNYCHFARSVQPAKRYDVREKKLPKTLVCHDMANGYHDDSFIDGSTKFDAYTFWNWAGIDIFCYFSHNLITIPPLAWINLGHNHGVKVIGTIITEWSEGTALWEVILSSKEEYEKFANSVVTIAKLMKFDGWLLNIENKITKPQMLLEFVRYLRERLHAELEDPVLIWYDSVTIHGKLNWQNGLNEKNIDFFNAADGFFTNYSWKFDDVKKTAEVAGDRLTDVFIGIDIWGRNFYGGGQFNTHEAVNVPYNEGCSLAIFAPAWTHEALTKDPTDLNYVFKAEALNKFQRFLLRDRALWTTLWPFLYTRLPCHLPFQTSFCRGQGIKRWMYGEVISPGPWYNLRHQNYQANSMLGDHGFMLTDAQKQIEKNKELEKTSFFEKYRTVSKIKAIEKNVPVEKNAATLNKEKKGIMKQAETVQDPESTASTTGLYARVMNFIQSLCGCKRTGDITAPKSPVCKFGDLPAGTSASPRRYERRLSTDVEIDHIGKHSSISSYERLSSDAQSSRTLDNNSQMPVHLALVDKVGHFEVARAPIIHDIDVLQTDSKESCNERAQSNFQTMSMNLNLKECAVKMRWVLTFISKERECFQPYYNDAYNGGHSLKVNPSDAVHFSHRINKLLLCDFPIGDHGVIVCVITKPLDKYPEQTLNVILEIKNKNEEYLEIILVGRNVSDQPSDVQYVYPLYSEEQDSFQELRRFLLTNEPTFYMPINNIFGWDVRYYLVGVTDATLTAIYCHTTNPQGGILLGHIGICPREN